MNKIKKSTPPFFIPSGQDKALLAVFALSVMTMPQVAPAACTNTGGSTYLCENANSAGIVITGTDIDIQTNPGFSVTVPGVVNPALDINGGGTISYIDTNGSPLSTGGDYSLNINNNSATSNSTIVQTNGAIGNGIAIEQVSQADSMVQVDVTGGLSGGENSAVLINSSVQGNSSVALNTQAISGVQGIYSDNVSYAGVTTSNFNIAGDIHVSKQGAYLSNSGYGGTSLLNLNAKNIITNADSIHISNANASGGATTNIIIDGSITSADGQAATFNNDANNGLISFKFQADNVSSQYFGLTVNNHNQNGAVINDIALSGDLTVALSGQGIRVNSSTAEGDVTSEIKLKNVYTSSESINIYNNTTKGNIVSNLNVSGDIISSSGDGLYMMNNSSEGNSEINANINNITADIQAINISNMTTAGTALTAMSVTGDIHAWWGGIIQTTGDRGDATTTIAMNNMNADANALTLYTTTDTGTATTNLSVSGQMTSTGNSGIDLNSSVVDGKTVTVVDVNNISSLDNAIHISSNVQGIDSGGSTIDAITRGSIISQQGQGINIETNTAETYLTVSGLVHGGDGTAIGINRLDGLQKSATLELQSGYVLEGMTQALVISKDYVDLDFASLNLADSHLVLGGAGNAAFDLNRIDNRQEAILDGDPNRITGFGTLAKTGNSVWTLTGTNTANGTVNLFSSASVEAGVLALDNSTLGIATGTALTVANGAALSSIGSSVLSGNLTNSGAVQLANQYTGGNGSFAGDTLTVTGNYTGNSGAYLLIDTVLGNDDSATDRLVINGDALGATSIKVNNAGGNGDQTIKGINIINVGGLSSDSAFLLDGDYVTKDGKQAVIGGAYAYTLQADGGAATPGRDWYLTSEMLPEQPGTDESRYQPGVPLYEQYPQVLAALNTLPTLQQRIGNRYWSQGSPTDSAANNDQWAWGRIEGSHQSSDPARSTSGSQRDIDLWKLQTGVDIPLHQYTDGSLLTGGVNFIYGKANADITSYYGDGSIDTSGYGVGTTLTWYGTDGMYIDGQLQTMWFDSDLKSDTLGRTMVSGNNGRGYASSIEGGKRYALNEEGLSLTPQMQLIYSRVDFNSFRDPYGSKVSPQDGNNLRARIGTSLDKETAWVAENGTTSRTHVYGNVDLYNEFTNGTKVKDSGVELSTRDERQWIGIGAGGTYEWQNGRYAVYGNLNLTGATNNISDNYAVGGAVGIRVGW